MEKEVPERSILVFDLVGRTQSCIHQALKIYWRSFQEGKDVLGCVLELSFAW